jgi:16S rRNA (guanine527-N7)-methyltransferase
MNLAEKLSAGIACMKLTATADQQTKLLQYLALLHKWNRVYNLTAIRQPEQMLSNHLFDSLAVLPYLWSGRWLDVGSGAGLPGIVLAVMQPDWSITMLDSNSKKTGFLQQAIIELGLDNAEVHCGRVERYAPAEKFDGIISRAFAEAADFVNLTRHLLAENGAWAAMKGAPASELERLPQGIEAKKIVSLNVPELEAARSLVVLGAEK